MADQLAPVLWRAVDSNGDPVPGAQATWEESGTTTPLTVYQNDALSSAHATPQVADGSGIFDQVFVTSGTAAKVTVRDPADDSVLYVIDPVPLTSTGGQSASNINFAAVTGNSATDTQSAIANNVTRINRLDNGSALATSGGSGGAYTMSSTFAITAYAARQVYEFVANHASVGGGTDTLNVSSVGAVVLKKFSGTTTKADLAAGDIATGDVVSVVYDGTHFVATNIQRDNSQRVRSLEFIESQDASTSATLDFTGFDATQYDAYILEVSNLVPATDNVQLFIRSSTDGGATYDSGASDYSWGSVQQEHAAATAATSAGINADTKIKINSSGDLGNAAGEDGWSGTIKVLGPHLAKKTVFTFQGVDFNRASGTPTSISGGGARLAQADVDAVRFLMSSGNIASGTITMYGVRNA